MGEGDVFMGERQQRNVCAHARVMCVCVCMTGYGCTSVCVCVHEYTVRVCTHVSKHVCVHV